MIGFYNYTVILTYLSLLSSATGIFFAAGNHLHTAVCCLLFSGLCDMFDGRVAKTKKRTKDEMLFGIQIDSLSDIVCFGVLPAVIGLNKFRFELMHGRKAGIFSIFVVFAILGLYILCGLIRLAYYNVREEQRQEATDGARASYVGLPITSMALILPIIYVTMNTIRAMSSIDDSTFCKVGTFVWFAMFVIVATLFITPFRVRKPDNSILMLFLLVGTILFVLVILLKLNLIHI